MLTTCRTLMGDPDLIMIDEPTEGLAPLIVQQVGDLIARIAQAGVAILLVEQKLSIAMRISKRVYIMGHGRVVFEGRPDELTEEVLQRIYPGGLEDGPIEPTAPAASPAASPVAAVRPAQQLALEQS
jgi:ABC-type branched-subunit amino acid transport system ATPase component